MLFAEVKKKKKNHLSIYFSSEQMVKDWKYLQSKYFIFINRNKLQVKKKVI